eukprot:SAG31_NODE_7534_length_1662_cov_1.420985_2_plen_145_part_00
MNPRQSLSERPPGDHGTAPALSLLRHSHSPEYMEPVVKPVEAADRRQILTPEGQTILGGSVFRRTLAPAVGLATVRVWRVAGALVERGKEVGADRESALPRALPRKQTASERVETESFLDWTAARERISGTVDARPLDVREADW